MDIEIEGVCLHYKVLGKFKTKPCPSIADAADDAVQMISAGFAIPKYITVDSEVVYTESDINTYWQNCIRAVS